MKLFMSSTPSHVMTLVVAVAVAVVAFVVLVAFWRRVETLWCTLRIGLFLEETVAGIGAGTVGTVVVPVVLLFCLDKGGTVAVGAVNVT